MVLAILLLTGFNALFWIAFEQAGSTLNVFASEKTDRMLTLPGRAAPTEVPATWFQSLNPFMIMTLAPIVGMLWSWLGRRGRNPSQPIKVTLGLLLVGAGYVLMVLAARAALGPEKAGMLWLVGTYLLHTLGELCISPTGLSFVTQAAPKRSVSRMMGVWFISSFLANLGGGLIGSRIEQIERGDIELFWTRWFKLGGQADYFFLFVLSSFLAAGIACGAAPKINRMLGQRPTPS